MPKRVETQYLFRSALRLRLSQSQQERDEARDDLEVLILHTTSDRLRRCAQEALAEEPARCAFSV